MQDDGSDRRFAQVADVSGIGRSARVERVRAMLEEWRVRQHSPANDEPGRDYPTPDEPPPPNEPHPEFDPTPPR